MNNQERIDRLSRERRLKREDWVALFSTHTQAERDYATTLARERTVATFGKTIYFRGIVEFTNYCRNNCMYCGIRRDNHRAVRYRLSPEDILYCCQEGYDNGFRTFVLQGGEDAYFTDERMCALVRQIKERFSDCAVTLSLGERSRASYQALFEAGADRYLLRHETADPSHYARLHPPELSLAHRIQCLQELKEIGYQTGCGCMVGTPYQTPETLAEDMLLMERLQPEMVGLGPFIPHQDTPLGNCPMGSISTTLFVISLCRLMLPWALIPSTTALGTADQEGRKQGVLAGCNVVMPNLSPLAVRKKYMLYDNKVGTEMTAAEGIALLRRQMKEIGYEVVTGRGDFSKEMRS